ncbi:MAG: acyltransferase family protein, partial [Aeromicrobium sp.]
MTVAAPEKPTTRIAIFDGIRGVAIVLVLLSHGWLLWPTEQIDRSPLLDAVFSNGDAAVSVFFVVGSFLATRNLLRLADGPSGLHPAVATLRRFVRLSGQTYLLLVTVVVVTVFDSSNTYAGTNLGKSVFTSATYTWNWYVRNDPAEARPDLGHLWYLSVDFQVFLLVLAAVCLMRHRRVRLVLVLSAMLVLMLWWRSHMYALDPAGTAVRTWARGDAPVAGALAASALPFVGRLVPYARAMAIGAAVLLLPVLYLT